MVPADDNGRAIGVEKKDVRVRGSFLEEEMLDREVDVRIVAARYVDLMFYGGIACELSEGRGWMCRVAFSAALQIDCRVLGSQCTESVQIAAASRWCHDFEVERDCTT